MSTEAEATFRLLLHQSPHLALAAFLRGTAGVKPCGGCKGSGKVKRLVTPYDSEIQECPVCHGHGSKEAELREAYRGVNRPCDKCCSGSLPDFDRNGVASIRPCPTCHGNGGRPSADLLNIAADFYGDETMEGSVLRQLALSQAQTV